MTEPSSAQFDPRLRPDFMPELLPLCDSQPPPSPETVDRHERLMIEFAAAYYEMNRALDSLQKARAAGDAKAETAALEDLRAASHARDALEDRCAPEGFYAEPALMEDRYAGLHFTWANKPPPPRVYAQRFEAQFIFA